jgi:outer membrane protein OmpA-like peptidoglycan-associated protein
VRWLIVALLCASAAAAPPGLHVAYDIDHLDLDKHVLQFKPSLAITNAELAVLGEDGKELDHPAVAFADAHAGQWLTITWNQPADARVLKLQLRVTDSHGNGVKLELVPWSVTVDHQDVNFASDSAVIDDSEANKLDASLAKIQDIVSTSGKYVKMTLYVAGHTDTVGPSAKNRTLSLARATAIAQYFRKHGLAIPIIIAGFGESVLKVQTRDETDERANRRADYVLGPTGGTPPFRGPYLKVKATWKAL